MTTCDKKHSLTRQTSPKLTEASPGSLLHWVCGDNKLGLYCSICDVLLNQHGTGPAFKGVLVLQSQVNGWIVPVTLISLPVHLSDCIVDVLSPAGSLHCDSNKANLAIKLLQHPDITEHCNCTLQLCHVQHCSTIHSNTLDSYHKWWPITCHIS